METQPAKPLQAPTPLPAEADALLQFLKQLNPYQQKGTEWNAEGDTFKELTFFQDYGPVKRSFNTLPE